MLVIGHRECEAGGSHIPTLQLLVSVTLAIEPAVALGREGTAVIIAILRGLGSNPPETSCLWCPAAMSISPVCIYWSARQLGMEDLPLLPCCVCVGISNTNTKYSSIAFLQTE
jgi:hypothetical protein